MQTPAIAAVRKGCVIPAHPWRSSEARRLDERRQRALTRYYVEPAPAGVAVGVHTTQFAIHEPRAGCCARCWSSRRRPRATDVAAANAFWSPESCGPTDQAVDEAELAAELGYDLVLLMPYGAGDVERSRAARPGPRGGRGAVPSSASICSRRSADATCPATSGRGWLASRVGGRHQGRAVRPVPDARRRPAAWPAPVGPTRWRSTPATTTTSSPT